MGGAIKIRNRHTIDIKVNGWALTFDSLLHKFTLSNEIFFWKAIQIVLVIWPRWPLVYHLFQNQATTSNKHWHKALETGSLTIFFQGYLKSHLQTKSPLCLWVDFSQILPEAFIDQGNEVCSNGFSLFTKIASYPYMVKTLPNNQEQWKLL